MQKILFIKTGNFSFINDNLYEAMCHGLKNTTIEVLDVRDVVKNDLPFYVYLINIFFFLKEYGSDFIKRYKRRNDLLRYFQTTAYFAHQTAKIIRRKMQGRKYLFSLQTQSLINGKLNKIPHFIYTDHTCKSNLLYPDINPKNYLSSISFIEKIEMNIYRDADMIFTFGSLPANSLQQHYRIDRTKIKTVFAGSNQKGGYNEKKSRYHSKNILFVGVDWERKGGHTVLKVFRKLLDKHPDATLTIIGCAPEIGDMPRCNVLGKVPPDVLPDYYNNASVFFLPTIREPFGIVFIEAMYYRLPVVSNNIGSLSDIITNGYNGYLVNNDVDEYVNKISILFEDPDLCVKMGYNGYERMKSNFTWKHVVSTMKACIDDYLKVDL